VLAAPDVSALSDDGVRQIVAHNRKVQEFCRS
jgi:hypothetical protein